VKILLDEDVSQALVRVLRDVVPHHVFKCVDELRWKSKKDVALFRDARSHGFDAIISCDRGQLTDPDHLKALRASKMHHVLIKQYPKKPVEGVALQVADVLAAIHPLLADLTAAKEAQSVEIRQISSKDRYTVGPVKSLPYGGR